MEIAPHDREAHALRFPGPGRELERMACPQLIFRINAAGFEFSGRATEVGEQSRKRSYLPNFEQIDERFDRLTLTEVITELDFSAISIRHAVRTLEPVTQ